MATVMSAAGLAALHAGAAFVPSSISHELSAGSTALPEARLEAHAALAEAAAAVGRPTSSAVGDLRRRAMLAEMSITMTDARRASAVGDVRANARFAAAHGAWSAKADLVLGSLGRVRLDSPSSLLGDLSSESALSPSTLSCGELAPGGAASPEPPLRQLVLDAAHVSSDPVDRAYPARYAVDGRVDTCTRWRSGAHLALWSARLPPGGGPPPFLVQVEWEQFAAPAAVMLQLGWPDRGEWVTCDGVEYGPFVSATTLYGDGNATSAGEGTVSSHGATLTCWRYPRTGGGSASPLAPGATHLRLVLRGTAASNTRKRLGMRAVTVFAGPDEAGWAPPPLGGTAVSEAGPVIRVQAALVDAIRGVVLSGDAAGCAGLTRALAALALATGSSAGPLRVAAALLELQGASDGAVLAPRGVRLLARALGAAADWSARRAAAVAWVSAQASAQTVAVPSWDVDEKCSRNIVVSGGGSVVSATSAEDRHQVALGSTGFPLRGHHSWTIAITHDVSTDECICAGLGVWPVRDPHYETTADLWLVRCYNGQTYCRAPSRSLVRLPHGAVHPGSELTFHLDGDARTVNVSVDHVPQGVVFSLPSDAELNASALEAARREGRTGVTAASLPPPLVYPAITMYSSGRKATLVSVHTERVQPPSPSEEPSLARMPLLELPTAVPALTPSASAGFGRSASSPRGTPQLVGSLAFGGKLPPVLESSSGGSPTEPSSHPRISFQGRSYDNSVALLADVRVVRALVTRAVVEARSKAAAMGQAPLPNGEWPKAGIRQRRLSSAAIEPLNAGDSVAAVVALGVTASATASAVVAVARFSLGRAWDTLSFGLGASDTATSPIKADAATQLRSGALELRVYTGGAGEEADTLVFSSKGAVMAEDADRPGTFSVPVRHAGNVTIAVVATVTASLSRLNGGGDDEDAWLTAGLEGCDDEAVHLTDVQGLEDVATVVARDLVQSFVSMPCITLTDPRLGPAPLSPAPRVEEMLVEGQAAMEGEGEAALDEAANEILLAVTALAFPPRPADMGEASHPADFFGYVERLIPFPGLVATLQAQAREGGVLPFVPQTPAAGRLPSVPRPPGIPPPPGVLPHGRMMAAGGHGGGGPPRPEARLGPSSPVVPPALARAPVPEPAAAPPPRAASAADAVQAAVPEAAALAAAAPAPAPAPVPAPAPASPPAAPSSIAILLSRMSAAELAETYGVSGEELDEDLAAALLMSLEEAPARPSLLEAPSSSSSRVAGGSAPPEALRAAASALSPVAEEGTTCPAAEEAAVVEAAGWTVEEVEARVGALRHAAETCSDARARDILAAWRGAGMEPLTKSQAVEWEEWDAGRGRAAVTVTFFGHTWRVDVADSRGGPVEGVAEAAAVPEAELERRVGGRVGAWVARPQVELSEDLPLPPFAGLREVPRLPEPLAQPTPFGLWPSPALMDALLALLQAARRMAGTPLATGTASPLMSTLALLQAVLETASAGGPAAAAVVKGVTSHYLNALKQLAGVGGEKEGSVSAQMCLARGLPVLCTTPAERLHLLLQVSVISSGSWEERLLRRASWDALAVPLSALTEGGTGDAYFGPWHRLLAEWLPLAGFGADAVEGSVPTGRTLSAPLPSYSSVCYPTPAILLGPRLSLLDVLLRAALTRCAAVLLDGPACINSRLDGATVASAVSAQREAVAVVVALSRPIVAAAAAAGRPADVLAGSLHLARQAVTALSMFVAHIPVAAAVRGLLHPLVAPRLPAAPIVPRPRPINVMKEGRAGNRDNFTGSVGARVRMPVKNGSGPVLVTALGRFVDRAINGGVLQHAHTLSLWRESDQALLATAVVDNSSRRDRVGYAIGALEHLVALIPGAYYRLASSETAGSGDAWHDANMGGGPTSAIPHEPSLVLVAGDCFVQQPGTWASRADAEGAQDADAGANTDALFCPSSGALLAYPASSSGKQAALGPVTMFVTPAEAAEVTEEALAVELMHLAVDTCSRAAAVLTAGAPESEEEEALAPWLASGIAVPASSQGLRALLRDAACATTSIPAAARSVAYSAGHALLHLSASDGGCSTFLLPSPAAEWRPLPALAEGQEKPLPEPLSDDAWGLLLSLCDSEEEGGALPSSVMERAKLACPGAMMALEAWRDAAGAMEEVLQAYGPEPKLARKKPRYHPAMGPLLAALLLHSGCTEVAAEAVRARLEKRAAPPPSPSLAALWQRFKLARTWLRSAVADARRVEAEAESGEAGPSRRRGSSDAGTGRVAPGPSLPPLASLNVAGEEDNRSAGFGANEEDEQEEDVEEGEEEDGGEGEEEEGEEEEGEEEEGEEDEGEEEEEDEGQADLFRAVEPGPVGPSTPAPPSPRVSNEPALFAGQRRTARMRRERAAAWAPSTIARLLGDARARALFLLSSVPARSRFDAQGGSAIIGSLLETLTAEADADRVAVADARAAARADEGGDVAAAGMGSPPLPALGMVLAQGSADPAEVAALTLVTLYFRHGSAANPRLLAGCAVRASVRAAQRTAGLDAFSALLEAVGGRIPTPLSSIVLRYVPPALAGVPHAVVEETVATAVAACREAAGDWEALTTVLTTVASAASSEHLAGLELLALAPSDAHARVVLNERGGALQRVLLRLISAGDVLVTPPVPGCAPAAPPAECATATRVKPIAHPRYSIERARSLAAGTFSHTSGPQYASRRAGAFLDGAPAFASTAVTDGWEKVRASALALLLQAAEVPGSTSSSAAAQDAMRAAATAARVLCAETLPPAGAPEQALSAGLDMLTSAYARAAAFPSSSSALGTPPDPSAFRSAVSRGRVSVQHGVQMLRLLLACEGDGDTQRKTAVEVVIASAEAGGLEPSRLASAYSLVHHAWAEHQRGVSPRADDGGMSFWSAALGGWWMTRLLDILTHHWTCEATMAAPVRSLRRMASSFARAALRPAIALDSNTGDVPAEGSEAEAASAADAERASCDKALWRLHLQGVAAQPRASPDGAARLLIARAGAELGAAVESMMHDRSTVPVAEARSQQVLTTLLVLASVPPSRQLAAAFGSVSVRNSLLRLLCCGTSQSTFSSTCRLLQQVMPMLDVDAAPLCLPVLPSWRELSTASAAGPAGSVTALLLSLLDACLHGPRGLYLLPVGGGHALRVAASELVCLLRVLWRSRAEWARALTFAVKSAVDLAVAAALVGAPSAPPHLGRALLPAICISGSTAELEALQAGATALRLVSTASGTETVHAGGRVALRRVPLLSADTAADYHALVGGGAAVGLTEGLVIEHCPSTPVARVAIVSFGPGDADGDRAVASLLGLSSAVPTTQLASQRMPYARLLDVNAQLHARARNPLFGPSIELVDTALLLPVDLEPPVVTPELALRPPSRALSNDSGSPNWLVALVALATAEVPMAVLTGLAGGGATPQVSPRDALAVTSAAAVLCTLRWLALGALEQALLQPDATPALMATLEGPDGARHSTLALLASLACTPVQTPTFVAPARLHDMAATLQCAALESRDAAERPSVAALPPGQELLACVVEADGGSSPVSAAPASLSERDIARREAATTLCAMGFGFDLAQCTAALRRSADDMNRAAEFLMSPEARRILTAEAEASTAAAGSQLTAAAIASVGLGGLGHATATAAAGQTFVSEEMRWARAADLASIWGMPLPLCHQALLIQGDDANAAMTWLMDRGTGYLDAMMDESQLDAAAVADAQAEQEAEARSAPDDAAVLESTSIAPPLIDAIDGRTAGPGGEGAPSPGRAAASAGPPMVDFTGRTQYSGAQLRVHRAAAGEAELFLVDPETDLPPSPEAAVAELSRRLPPGQRVYLTRYAGHVESAHRAPVPLTGLRAATVVEPGVLVLPAPSGRGTLTLVLVASAHPSTGTLVVRAVSPACVRTSRVLFGQAARTPDQTSGLYAAVVTALASHAARRVVAAALHNWPSRMPLTVSALGGSSGLLRLLKLAAASSPAFGTGAMEGGEGSDVASYSDPYAVISRLTFSKRAGGAAGLPQLGDDEPEALATEVVVLPCTTRGGTQGVPVAIAPVRKAADVAGERSARTPRAPLLASPLAGRTGERQPRGTPRDSAASNELGPEEETLAPAPAGACIDVLRSILLRLLLDEAAAGGAGAGRGLPPLSARRLSSSSNCASGELADIAAATGLSLLPGGTEELLPLLDLSVDSGVSEALPAPSVAPVDQASRGGGLLAAALLDQCVSNFVATTTAVAGGSGGNDVHRLSAESLHPFLPRCEYVTEMVVEGARALRVMFDPRCELYNTGSTLTFYSDRECSLQLASYPVRSVAAVAATPLRGPAAFPPLVVQADRVYVRFRADRREEANLAWGYRFVLSAMRGLAWTSEVQAAAEGESSLQWACWCLDFLLQDAGSCNADLFAAAHTRPIFDALVRYVRTPNAPFKAAIASLLIKLLMNPQVFVPSELPDLRPLLSVADLVLTRTATERESGNTFLSPSLLRLVELAAATYKADRELTARTSPASDGIGAGFAPITVALSHEGKVVPPLRPTLRRPDENLTLRDIVMDAEDLAASLASAPALATLQAEAAGVLAKRGPEGVRAAAALRSGALCLPPMPLLLRPGPGSEVRASHPLPAAANRLPDALLARAWLDSAATIAVVESEHPYIAGESQSGWVVVPGATSIKIALDRRTCVAIGCVLNFYTAGGEHVVPTLAGMMMMAAPSAEGEPVGGLTPGDMKTWTASQPGAKPRDVVDVPGDRVRWEWSAPCLPRESTDPGSPVATPPAPPMPASPAPGAGEACAPSARSRSSDAAPHPAGLWGFTFTVAGATWRELPGTRIASARETALVIAGASVDGLALARADSEDGSPVASSPAFPVPGALTLTEAAVYMAVWPHELDALLVAWLSRHSAKTLGAEDDGDVPTSPSAAGGSKRTLRGGAVDASPADVRPSRKEWRFAFEPLTHVPLRALHLRVALLRLWNKRVGRLLELVDVHAADAATRAAAFAGLLAASGGRPGGSAGGFDPSSLTAGARLLSVQVRSLGHLIVSELKQRLLDTAVALSMSTMGRGSPRPSISLDYMRSMAGEDAGGGDIFSSQAIFMQAYRQLAKVLPPAQLSNLCRLPIDDRGRIWTVVSAPDRHNITTTASLTSPPLPPSAA
jgi:hypothetical protein